MAPFVFLLAFMIGYAQKRLEQVLSVKGIICLHLSMGLMKNKRFCFGFYLRSKVTALGKVAV